MKFIITAFFCFLSSFLCAAENAATCGDVYGVSIYSFKKSGNISEPIFNKSQSELDEWIKANYKNVAERTVFQTVIIAKDNDAGYSELTSLKDQPLPLEIKDRVEKSQLKPVGISSKISLKKQTNPDGLAIEIDYLKSSFKKFQKKSELPFFKNEKISEAEDLLFPLYDYEGVRTNLRIKAGQVYILSGAYSTDRGSCICGLHYELVIVEKL